MKKILVAFSGGVDSAVSAYLLKTQGYEVTALFMRNWDNVLNNDLEGMHKTVELCEQEQDYNIALEVAKVLDIPLLRVDFVKEYYDEVFTHFLQEYRLGRTPNPDILCNKVIKFKHLTDYAHSLGYEYVATGHYARIVQVGEDLLVAKGKDNDKDQSYFLSTLSTKELQGIIFPLGEYTKTEVRKMAKSLALPNYNKKGSSGICFIGERNFLPFLRSYLDLKKGPVIDILTNKTLSTHEGALYYTIGQRQGLKIGGIQGHNKPWFVVKKDISKNIIYVTDDVSHPLLNRTRFKLANVIVHHPFSIETIFSLKVRYRQKDVSARLELIDGNYYVSLKAPLRAITPGQQAVFYYQNAIYLSGVIDD